ncbi:MAG: TnpV protein [Actinobacteria bacterium]|nr:TnpV protein [Actinomycetota bacterium]
MSHWKRTDPDRYATIADPQTFFRDLGEQAETQIQELAARLAGPDQPGEEYLQKVGRLNMARLQAEEAVLADLVWISGPEEEEESPDPTTAWVTQTMREMAASDEDEATEN